MLWGIDLAGENENDQNREHWEDHKCVYPPLGDTLPLFKERNGRSIRRLNVRGLHNWFRVDDIRIMELG